LCHVRVVVVSEQAGRGLRQADHLDLCSAQELCLVVDVVVLAGCEWSRAAGQQPTDMNLQAGRQQPAVFDLNCRIGRRNQHTEMMHCSPTSLDACVTDKLGSAERMSKLGQAVVPARLICRGEMRIGTAWARD